MASSSSFGLSSLLGRAYTGGNVVFTPDGATLLSPVGNRVTALDLTRHASHSAGVEARSDIAVLALSPDGRVLLAIDVDGHAIVANVARRVTVARFSFKAAVACAAFSPDGRLLAAGVGRSVQIWRAPALEHHFSHFALVRAFTVCHDAVTSLDWSPTGRQLVCGSEDLTARIFTVLPGGSEIGRLLVPVTLSGHRERVVAAVFGDDDTVYSVSADGALFAWVWRPVASTSALSAPCLSSKLGAGLKRRRSSEAGGDVGIGDGGGRGGAFDKLSLAALASARRPSVPGGAPHAASVLGEWRLEKRHFLRQAGAKVSSCVLHRQRSLLVVGLSDGTFGLYTMPGCENVHTLSISQHRITSAAVNASGNWVAFGSSELSQLLVWDWASELYVIKQQGHGQDVSCTAFSPNGQLLASGGEDGKVKLWNTASGFSFVTFASHSAAVTAVTFVGGKRGHGLVVLSASLDGTVRAYDLVRYRNFKSLSAAPVVETAASGAAAVQFSCVAGDEAGEIVCAGGLDPFNVYVWSLQTGRLLDVLAGHGGPVASLAFSSAAGLLASCSWDKTVRLWDVFRAGGTASETFLHAADVLAVAFRPDGLELCASTLDGNLNLWDVRRGVQLSTIDARHDLAGGRLSDEARRSSMSRNATSLCYAADGSAIMAGGNSRFVCLYALPSKMLVRRFQVSLNRALDGVLDKLDSRRLGEDGVPLDEGDFDAAAGGGDGHSRDRDKRALPGVRRGDAASKRNARRAVWSRSVQFSPAGDMFAVVTPDGVSLYRQDEVAAFDPFELGEDVTLDALEGALREGRFVRAALLALHLGEASALARVLAATPLVAVRAVARAVPRVFLLRLLAQVATQLATAPHLEFSLAWVLAVLEEHGDALRREAAAGAAAAAPLQQLQKALLAHRESLGRLVESNRYALDFIVDQGALLA